MAWVALLRHGVTAWNERGVIQGRTDIPLSAGGVAALQRVRPGDAFLRARWVTSPLQRAVQTAAILNPGVQADIHPDLIETHWGEFEGVRRDELPQRIRDLALVPACGLDFLPPGGESARMVQRRLLRWFEATADADSDTTAGAATVVAVTHKGVIRSALSAACGWDMSGDLRPKPDWSLPHLFRLGADGKLQLVRLNCPWAQPPDSDSADSAAA